MNIHEHTENWTTLKERITYKQNKHVECEPVGQIGW